MRQFVRPLVLAGFAFLALTVATMVSTAQPGRGKGGDRGGQPGGDRGGQQAGGDRGGQQGGRGNFDPAQMRERYNQMLKERLEVSDDEWKVIEPLMTKVREKQDAARMRSFSMFGDRGPGGDRGGDRGSNDAPEMEELRKAIESKDTPAAEVQAKLKAFRDARTKKEAELKDAREELRKVLTARQEAQLVLMGTLD